MQNTHSLKAGDRARRPHRSEPKLPAFARNLNASQRACLTKLSLTGQRDMTKNLKASEKPARRAAWLARKEKEAA